MMHLLLRLALLVMHTSVDRKAHISTHWLLFVHLGNSVKAWAVIRYWLNISHIGPVSDHIRLCLKAVV